MSSSGAGSFLSKLIADGRTSACLTGSKFRGRNARLTGLGPRMRLPNDAPKDHV
jgi:hypothetical protein